MCLIMYHVIVNAGYVAEITCNYLVKGWERQFLCTFFLKEFVCTFI